MSGSARWFKRCRDYARCVRAKMLAYAWIRVTLACLRLVVFLTLIAIFLFDTSSWIGGWSVTARIVAAAMVVFMAHAYTDRSFKARIRKSSQKAEFDQLDEGRAKQLQDEIRGANLLTPEQADVFIQAIVAPPKLHQRITENYKTNQRTMRREVTIDVRIPRHIMRRALASADEDSGQATFLYPVIVPPKGIFYDDLKIYDANGESLTVLSYREYLHHAASVIDRLTALACGESPADLPSEAIEAERQAIWGIIQRIDTRPVGDTPAPRTQAPTAAQAAGEQFGQGTGKQSDRTAATEPTAATGNPEPLLPGSSQSPAARAIEEAGRELARSLLRLGPVKSDETQPDEIQPDETRRVETRRRAIRMAAQLTEVLYSHYAIVAAVTVPASGRFSLKYECTVIPELDLAPLFNRLLETKSHGKGKLWLFAIRKMRAFITRLHIFLSSRPADVKISLDNAWRCQSYHVIVRGSDGMYLTRQEFSSPHEDYLKRKARSAPSLPHIRFRRRLGQPYAHFYARFLPPPRRASFKDGNFRPAEKAPKLILTFQEVPPGSICPAALAAIAAAALIWVIGYGLSHAGKDGVNTDVPLLLLAFPGVAASWLGFDGGSHLFEGALVARLSLACTAIISLFAAGLYALRILPASVPLILHARSTTLGVLGITLWPWAALTVVALFNACYLSYRWIVASWRFRHFADRHDPAALVAKVRQGEDAVEEAIGA
jgi:hypothetical protein